MLTQKVDELNRQWDAKNTTLYQGAFEWRFEFPEVLDEDGQFTGFDVVVGNPPYIRQEELGDYKPYFAQTYAETAAGTADLYVYFVERGMSILRAGGQFSYILPNKWMRAGYGENLRSFVLKQHIRGISDFGDLPVFDEATTYPCILELEREKPATAFPATHIQTLEFEESLSAYIRLNRIEVHAPGLQPTGWTLSDRRTQALMDKLRKAGKPLGDYVNNKIFRGVLTGFNKAFVITAETRKRLIAEDPRSAEIIKPFSTGRDLKRYQTPVSDNYLVFTRRGINIDNYPSVKKHLEQYKTSLEPKPKGFKGAWPGRKEGSYKWYEIQDAVDYYMEFEKPKITLPDIVKKNASPV